MKLTPFALILLVAAPVPALAGANAHALHLPPGIAVSEDRTQVTVTPASDARTKSVVAPLAKLPAIVNNLADKYPSGRYGPYSGYSVYGPQSAFGNRGWEAVAFVPATDVTTTRLEAAVKFVSGTNRAVLSLQQDDAGLPGAVLQSWTLKDLPESVTCCTTSIVKSAGIPLQAGHRYWVVLSTDGKSKDTFVTWQANVTVPLEQGQLARDQGEGWNGFTQAPLPAFAVFGAP